MEHKHIANAEIYKKHVPLVSINATNWQRPFAQARMLSMSLISGSTKMTDARNHTNPDKVHGVNAGNHEECIHAIPQE